MAMDQAMLEQTACDGEVRLRFYRWANPTVSLGYFQKYSDALAFGRRPNAPGQDPSIELRPLDVVRRATGGGAIVHQYDWTYSISIPACLDEAKKTTGASCGLYSRVHESVVEWLDRQAKRDNWMGQPACRWPDTDIESSKGGCAAGHCEGEAVQKMHFLCFMRRSIGDIVIGPHKVMGSAQRRYQSAILQHGSLLLATSPYAPHLVGLREINRMLATVDDHGNRLLNDFAQSLVENLAECYHFRPQLWDKDQPFVNVSDDSRKRLESPSWTARM